MKGQGIASNMNIFPRSTTKCLKALYNRCRSIQVNENSSSDEDGSDLGDETGVCVNDHYILARGQEAHAGPVGFP